MPWYISKSIVFLVKVIMPSLCIMGSICMYDNDVFGYIATTLAVKLKELTGNQSHYEQVEYFLTATAVSGLAGAAVA